ncbi:MAG: sigma-54-dependent Fis family transcriptional regulator [Cytophagia bacterium]|nr:MAG: sigma-54-dependent Fis family transcriptional regulator [Cytophagia bacterium]TAG46581.1 MAG: sigma-54-dependent Fis family transcriptional regulator [Cytophagia bacterium]
MFKILIVDDDTDVLIATKLLLKRYFKQIDTEKNPDLIPFLINSNEYDAVLLDMNFTHDVSSGNEGFMWLDRILDLDNQVSVVFFTAYGDVEMAVKAIKLGAIDFVLKPWENEKLLKVMENAVNISQQKKQKNEINTPILQLENPIIFKSEIMQKIMQTIEKIAKTDANILILGENGTGKDVIAKAIHQYSLRNDKNYIAADLGAISENLFESELFGHIKGAFTDAKEERIGRFEEANQGTIFLDEIGNIPLTLQAKLLTVLQNRTITKVGSNKSKTIDVRLICATNMPIYQMINQRQFRQDLLYRINTIEIKLPPLRERIEDILPLSDYFIKVYRKKYHRQTTTISQDLLKKMQQYEWKGNIRELQHAIERAVIMSENKVLQIDDFFFDNESNANFEQSFQLEEMEKILIIKQLKKMNGNISEVAKELGLTRQALYRRIEKYGL